MPQMPHMMVLGHVDSHAEHYEARREMDEGQIISGCLFIAGRDAPVVFDAVHEAFDEVAGFVGSFVESTSSPAIAAGRNDWLGTTSANAVDQLVGVVAFVSNHRLGLVLAEQFFRSRYVMLFARPQAKLQRLALGVYGQVQFAAESAARATERFVMRFFLGEPAAC
jgi:hypothetical protein